MDGVRNGSVLRAAVLAAAVVAAAAGCQRAPEGEPRQGDQVVEVRSTRELAAFFDRLGYNPDENPGALQAVPRLRYTGVPRDWAEEPSVSLRKSVFFRAMASAVLQVNEQIAADRARLLAVGPDPADPRDRAWLEALARRYRAVKAGQPVDEAAYRELVRRVDVIPPSLALAQAAVESGWGRSRFAREGNALFGQWTTSEDGMRARGADVRLASFDSPCESVAAYALNLNSHRAYRGLWDARARMRAEGRTPDGYELAGYLTSYAEDGQAYVRTLRTIIRSNGLEAFDNARLAEGTPVLIRPTGEG